MPAPVTAALSRLRGLAARLLLHANLVGQLDQLPQIPPLFFIHQSSVRTRKVNRDESFGGQRGSDNQLCLLVFGQCFGHGQSSRWTRILSRIVHRIVNLTLIKTLGSLYYSMPFKSWIQIRGSAAPAPIAAEPFRWI